jgi:hypothetical protein
MLNASPLNDTNATNNNSRDTDTIREDDDDDDVDFILHFCCKS